MASSRAMCSSQTSSVFFLSPELVHDAHRVPAVGVEGLGQGDGLHHRVQRHHHILPAQPQLPGNLVHRGLPLVLDQEGFLGLEHPIGGIPDGAGHPDGAVVPEVAPDLPDDHGHAVGGKAHVHIHVKVVNGLDQPDAPPPETGRPRSPPARQSAGSPTAPGAGCRRSAPPWPADPPAGPPSSSMLSSLLSTFSLAVLTPQISTFPCTPSPHQTGCIQYVRVRGVHTAAGPALFFIVRRCSMDFSLTAAGGFPPSAAG